MLKTYDLKEIDIPNVRQEEKRLTETYKYQLEILFDLVKKLGFQAIYLLIDRPDETEKTGNNPEATYRLIQPLIKDLELLGLDGYGFKFFLWDQIEKFHREDARPDRILQYKLTWKRSVLQNVLSLRLKAFSTNHISTFKQLMSTETEVDVDEAICLMSNGSPRNLIRICERIFTFQAESNPDSMKIDFNSVDRGILDFCEMFFKEIYGEDLLKIIQRVGRELFTTNYVANDILKITTNSARNKITNWVNIGLVNQVGTVSVSYSTKPVNFYCVIDPIAVRLIHRTIPFDKFLNDRWIPCDNCASDNLIDIELYPEGNSPLCRECGRDLV
ncbi:MAG: hypothetical protein HOG49_21800 [Candidatus Scalindua sp.]|nr:hypothetical protein [Candidatus Scalindua sp.]